MKLSTRRVIERVLFTVDTLALSQRPLCACHRPLPQPVPEELRRLVDEARTALAGEPEHRADYLDIDK